MQVTGMLHSAAMLRHVGFPFLKYWGQIPAKLRSSRSSRATAPFSLSRFFKGGVGKEGKAGLVGRAATLKEALAEKERLYFAQHRSGDAIVKANGVTFEAGIPAKHEIYFSISDSTEFRAPTMTLTHRGGIDIEELDPTEIANRPFDVGAPSSIISPLVQHLPRLWDLVRAMAALNPAYARARLADTRTNEFLPPPLRR